jgi:hypothetical protein
MGTWRPERLIKRELGLIMVAKQENFSTWFAFPYLHTPTLMFPRELRESRSGSYVGPTLACRPPGRQGLAQKIFFEFGRVQHPAPPHLRLALGCRYPRPQVLPRYSKVWRYLMMRARGSTPPHVFKEFTPPSNHRN